MFLFFFFLCLFECDDSSRLQKISYTNFYKQTLQYTNSVAFNVVASNSIPSFNSLWPVMVATIVWLIIPPITASIAIGEGVGISSSSSAFIRKGRIDVVGNKVVDEDKKVDNLMINKSTRNTGDEDAYWEVNPVIHLTINNRLELWEKESQSIESVFCLDYKLE